MKDIEGSPFCPVCGLKQSEPFFDKNGSPSWATCDCCGFMAGHTNDSVEGVKWLRRKWIDEEGAQWFHAEQKPSDWKLEEQLKQIPERYK